MSQTLSEATDWKFDGTREKYIEKPKSFFIFWIKKKISSAEKIVAQRELLRCAGKTILNNNIQIKLFSTA